MESHIRALLQQGQVLPACPLALNSRRKLDERRQRALLRYYSAAGAGGVALGVHTTQFAIRDPKVGLFKPLLALAREEMDSLDLKRKSPLIRVAGICGLTKQACGEAEVIRGLGYHAALLSLGALQKSSERELLKHCRKVSEIVPIIGFYLQPAAGGRVLPFSFWRGFLEIENIVAIKIAPFNRYQTIDVVRAVIESGRADVALYTGNDDNILLDLITPYRFEVNGKTVERRIVGGLLGHWAVWTEKAVELLAGCHDMVQKKKPIPQATLQLAIEITDSNAAFFDAANAYRGCIPGIHEVLRRQGLLEGAWCLDPKEILSPGQKEEIDRVHQCYPHLHDDTFVLKHLDEWLN